MRNRPEVKWALIVVPVGVAVVLLYALMKWVLGLVGVVLP